MKKNAVKNFVQIFLVLITLTSVTFGQDPGKIKGKVIENENDAPLAYATVTIISSGGIIVGGANTDYDGNFSISPIPAGTYTIRISYAGVSMFVKDVKVSSNKTTSVDEIRFSFGDE